LRTGATRKELAKVSRAPKLNHIAREGTKFLELQRGGTRQENTVHQLARPKPPLGLVGVTQTGKRRGEKRVSKKFGDHENAKQTTLVGEGGQPREKSVRSTWPLLTRKSFPAPKNPSQRRRALDQSTKKPKEVPLGTPGSERCQNHSHAVACTGVEGVRKAPYPAVRGESRQRKKKVAPPQL